MMHIACAADDRYLPHAAALLHSLSTVDGGSSFTIHFMHDDTASDAGVARLGRYAQSLGMAFHPIRLGLASVQGLAASDRIPPLCWYRVMLPEMLPEQDRVIYFDTDIIVRDSVRPLWELDLSQHLVAAADDYLAAITFPQVARKIGIEYDNYFNSGVMVMNLAAMRAVGAARKIVDFGVSMGNEITFPDQDALNHVLSPRRHRLSAEWNFPPCTDYFLTKHADDPLTQSLRACKEVRAKGFNPKIIHYLANPKPWQPSCRYPYTWLYHQHRMKTDWPLPLPEVAKWFARTHLPPKVLRVAKWLLGRG